MRLALVLLLALSPTALLAQASEIPSAAPTTTPGQTPEERGRLLLDQMVTALGGPSWLQRQTITQYGRSAAFFHGAPTGQTVDYALYRQLPAGTRSEAERIEFITDKGMILPGKKRDVAQVWTLDAGTEITYKGNSPLPRDQVDDYLRRRAHSIEEVIRTWIHAPDVVIVSEGTTMVERHPADKVTILSANNDAVTLELDATTHLPLSRSFEWRNNTFGDHDLDREDYADYHAFDGLPTALTTTRYRNGDMIAQRFLTKVEYNRPLAPELFDPAIPLTKKK